MEEFLLVNLILLTGTCVHSVIGYGMALVCAPLLFFISPNYVPVPMMMNVLALSILLIIRERSGLRFNQLSWAILGNGIGVVAAVVVLLFLTGDGFSIVFGCLILLAVLISICGYHPIINRLTSSLAGFTSGFMVTCTSAGGPPIALLYQSSSNDEIRANLSALFIFSIVCGLFVLSMVGKVHVSDLMLFVECSPGVVLGFLLSRYLKSWLSNQPLRPFILSIAGLSGLYSIIQGVVT